MSGSVNVKGIRELQAALFKYNASLAAKVTQVSLRKGANYLRDKIRQNAPVSAGGSYRQLSKGSKPKRFASGSIKRSIVVKASKLNKVRSTGVVGVYVLIGGRQRMNPKGAYYARWVEHGFNHGSALISANEAIRKGLYTKAQKQAKLAQYRANAESRRRPGFKASKVGSVRVRAGGNSVKGKHFVKDALNRHSDKAADLIAQSSESVLMSIAKQLNFKVK